ncbi:phage terminase large subunit [Picosynechococcus sp. PCC 7117]|uniref:phage terminase large subunit n=1 Tax=Picosynechococcus sp. PCC 7117 TaxID=195498 RepID=UPI000810C899|nr:phage terminase large subunit [Picosynechococcus sp. PCC 7117]ANV88485.1 hypothetical protein AWQ22_14015 [Picosynechococcus sp. PCC 7117]
MTSLKLNLHKAQKEVFDDPARFKLVVAGRRLGKSRLLLTTAITKAMSFQGSIDPASPPVVLVVMPTLKACRSIHWEPLLRLLERQPFIENISKSDFRIKLKGEKPDILIRGADNHGDSLRGLKIYWAGVDEIQDFSPKAWEEVIYPALSDTPNSSALMIGTPKGKNHWLYDFHLRAKVEENWNYFHYTTKDNPFVPRAFLRQAKKTLPPKTYNQEFRASFEDFEGQIFDQFKDHHKITKPVDSDQLSYYIGVDWGETNPALSVIALSHDYQRFYIVDSWYNHSKAAITQDEFLEKLIQYCDKYNVYRCYMPDDRPSSIISARKLGVKRGVNGLRRAVSVSRNEIGVMDGCDMINSLFYQDRLFILSTLKDVISQYENYHRDTDIYGKLINKPAKNQGIHILDSSRYVITSLYKKILQK